MLLKNAFRNAWENWMTTVMLLKTRLISHLKSFCQYTLVMALSFGWQLPLFGLANVSNLILKRYVISSAKRDRNSCKQILFQQQKRPKPNTKRTNNVRSLSELSDGTNNRLNERFNKAEAIEERSSRGTNESPLVKKSALPKSPSAGHHHRHQSSGGSIYFLADMVSQACIKKNLLPLQNGYILIHLISKTRYQSQKSTPLLKLTASLGLYLKKAWGGTDAPFQCLRYPAQNTNYREHKFQPPRVT